MEIFCCICVSLFANSNSLNLFCLSEFAVCDIFFWSRNEFQNEFWNWTYRLLTWDASSRPDFASQASTWACTRGFVSCCVNAECPHLDWQDTGELNKFLLCKMLMIECIFAPKTLRAVNRSNEYYSSMQTSLLNFLSKCGFSSLTANYTQECLSSQFYEPQTWLWAPGLLLVRQGWCWPMIGQIEAGSARANHKLWARS